MDVVDENDEPGPSGLGGCDRSDLAVVFRQLPDLVGAGDEAAGGMASAKEGGIGERERGKSFRSERERELGSLDLTEKGGG